MKDFPGSWADYRVFEGGILQVHRRISTPEALAWSERCRELYRDFGVDYMASRSPSWRTGASRSVRQ